MDFLKIPQDIVIQIFDNVYDIENTNSIINDLNIYDYDIYLSYLYGTFQQINKKYKKEFSNDYYWKHILKYNNIDCSKNYMKKFIQSKILSYYYEMYYYYIKQIKYEIKELNVLNNNLELLETNKNKKNIFGNYINNNIYVLMNGYWYNNKKNIIFIKYNTPRNHVYKWEKYVFEKSINNTLKSIKQANKNVEYYNLRYNIIINYLKY